LGAGEWASVTALESIAILIEVVEFCCSRRFRGGFRATDFELNRRTVLIATRKRVGPQGFDEFGRWRAHLLREQVRLRKRPYCLNAKSRRSARCYKKLNSAGKLIQRTTSEAPQRRHVLHRTGCSQEDDQLLREGRSWLCAPGRSDRFDTARAGRLDQDPSPTSDDRHGTLPGHDLYEGLSRQFVSSLEGQPTEGSIDVAQDVIRSCQCSHRKGRSVQH
jgi:hypothetical protein